MPHVNPMKTKAILLGALLAAGAVLALAPATAAEDVKCREAGDVAERCVHAPRTTCDHFIGYRALSHDRHDCLC